VRATLSQDPLLDTSLPSATQPSGRAGGWSLLGAALLAAFYFATSLYVAAHRLLWFDEVVTVHIAQLPNLSTMLAALSHGADSLPPLYYMVVRAFGKAFGYGEIAVRLPSALAMMATLLITFDCARRLTDGLCGLIALAVASGPLAGEGFEARSYAIYIMLAALALWVWTYTGASEKLAAILFGAVLFLSVCFHYYAVLFVVPYGLWELSRWKPWQPPSAKLLAGIIGVAVPAALLSHVILSFSRKFAPGFWSRPSMSELTEIYSHIFVSGLFILSLIMIWVALTSRKSDRILLQPMPPGEAVGWLFLCLPLAGFVAAELKTNAFAVRYFLALVPGVAVALACWTWRHFHNAPRISLGIFLLLASWGAVKQLQVVRNPSSVESPGTRAYLGLEGSLRSEGKQFFIFSDPFLFLEAQYYSKYPDQCVLLLPSDFYQKATPGRSTPDPYMHQRVEVTLSHYSPLQIWQWEQLQEHASQSALIKPSKDALEAAKRAGFAASVKVSDPMKVVYLQ